MMRFLALIFAAFIALPALAQAPTGARRALLMEGKQTLTQKVLTRPGATLHATPGAGTGTPVPGFTLFHVYARQGSGAEAWIEVGRDATGTTEGWMREERALPWGQTMVLAFTNPAGRERTMFFAEGAALRRVILARDMAAAGAEARRANDGRVIALEPETYVDISRNFYLLPVLSAEEVENERGDRMRLLEVASAPAERRAPPPARDPLADFRGALVFVVDTTLSMQPYLDRTREAIRNVMARIGTTALRDRFRFGLVVYRDDLGGNPALEYVTRTYARADFSAPADAILPRIAEASAATESNEGFDEDAVAGLRAALDAADWNSLGGRFIILVTDAGTREATDARSSTRLGIAEMRELLKQRAIATFALHLLTPEGRNNHARARAQYRELTRFDGAPEPFYYPIPNGEVAAFGQTVEAITEALLRQVAAITNTPIAQLRGNAPAAPQVQQQIDVVGQAMRLAYLGRVQEAAAPDIVRSFTTDRDLADSNRANLDVRILLTRDQLSDLRSALRLVIDGANAGRLQPQTVFANIRNAALSAARDPRRIGNLERLGAAFGEYLDGLPYRSQVMELTERGWLELQSGGQRELLNALEAKLRLYDEYARTPALWTQLGSGNDAGAAVFPMPLDQLP
ncbi:VWA domain-containing protein [Roseomonas stagni]|uniref:VWA domain-containing protein n=1 Tax=Falsiroseomonas algicola TaxID=2716930 RepID=A0A6M1LJ63_9PROT|nr:vWA domain-containing protein [Falsiroseomonas algicola]NGM20301.1 VWA domain-containing protein [Falsiroseomonas algicola]